MFFIWGVGQETAIALGSSVIVKVCSSLNPGPPDLDLKPAFLQQLLGFERRGLVRKMRNWKMVENLETIVMSQGFSYEVLFEILVFFFLTF